MNNRTYYACHEVAIGPYCSQSGLPVHGLQSVNVNTTFSLEQVFELGQLDIYENIEGLPNVEMTLTKVLDGYPLIYHLGTRGCTSATLANRTNQRADVFLTVFSDAQDNASGVPTVQVYCSGMYTSSLNYSLPVQGNATESVTFVGNDKVWRTTGFAFNGHFTGSDSPASGTQRRQNVKMGSQVLGGSVWPANLPNIDASGYNQLVNGVFASHIQDVTISTNLGRDDLYELGRRRPYYRYANFPVAVDTTINMIVAGDEPGDMIDAKADSLANLTNEQIVIKLDDGTIFDIGDKNKLQSVTYSGGDSGGGVVTASYAYQNFNHLTITSAADPESQVA